MRSSTSRRASSRGALLCPAALLAFALGCADASLPTAADSRAPAAAARTAPAPSAARAPSTTATTTVTAVLLAAGDIASCSSSGDEATAKLLDGLSGTILPLGDLAYDKGTATEFRNCYGPSWGRHLSRSRPAPGNHEYESSGAAPYYAYFGDRAGPAGKGYYSFDVGGWHVVSLNSNVSMSSTSSQGKWLKADLAAHPAKCTLAYFHHPRFSSGSTSGTTSVKPLWQALYDAGADVILNGHAHDYERFAPQTPGGSADDERGIREFVVGTGGKSLSSFSSTRPNSQFRYRSSYGVLQLELSADSYKWSFITTSNSVKDSGTASCH